MSRLVKRSILVANAPNLDIMLLRKLLQYERSLVFAVDGAADTLLAHELIPDFVLGDFDSIQAWAKDDFVHMDDFTQTQVPYAHRQITIVPAWDQGKTDLEKAIIFSDQLRCGSVIIFNALGGRVDHSEYNLRLLGRYYRQDRPILLRTVTEKIIFIRDQTVQLSGQTGDNITFFAQPEAVLTSQGLYYDMQERALHIHTFDSMSNALQHETAKVQIKGEVLCVMSHTLKVSII